MCPRCSRETTAHNARNRCHHVHGHCQCVADPRVCPVRDQFMFTVCTRRGSGHCRVLSLSLSQPRSVRSRSLGRSHSAFAANPCPGVVLATFSPAQGPSGGLAPACRCDTDADIPQTVRSRGEAWARVGVSIVGRLSSRQGRSAPSPLGFHLDPPPSSRSLASRVSHAENRFAHKERRTPSCESLSGANSIFRQRLIG